MFHLFASAVPKISAEEVKKSIDTQENVKLLDVRTSEEYAKGRIQGSMHLPLDEVAGRIESLIPDKAARIYVYCLSGSRSVYAVETMIKLGYSNVFDLPNGLLVWRIKGYPVIK